MIVDTDTITCFTVSTHMEKTNNNKQIDLPISVIKGFNG